MLNWKMAGAALAIAAGSMGPTPTATAQGTGQQPGNLNLPPIQVEAQKPKAKAKRKGPAAAKAAPAPASATSDVPAPPLPAVLDANSGAGAVERAQATPSASTVVSRSKIEDSGISSLEEATRLAPNVRFSTIGAPRFTANTVRGIGNTIADNYFNSPIGIYVDGVQISNAEFNRSLGDAQSVELLRGPQGTLFGHNALGGVINITSREPTREPKGEISATIGNNGQRGGSAALSGPVIGDVVTARGFFEYVTRRRVHRLCQLQGLRRRSGKLYRLGQRALCTKPGVHGDDQWLHRACRPGRLCVHAVQRLQAPRRRHHSAKR